MKSAAVRNSYPDNVLQLGARTFEMKDLDYDSYIEFLELSRPLIAAVGTAIELKSDNGEMGLAFNPMALDYENLIRMAGKDLPKMAQICLRQSDPSIKVDEIKRLARRPHVLVEIVLKQVKHNGIVQEFADFFQRMGAAITDLMPPTMTTPPTTSE